MSGLISGTLVKKKITIIISNTWDNLTALSLSEYLYLLFHTTAEIYKNISPRSISEPSMSLAQVIRNTSSKDFYQDI